MYQALPPKRNWTTNMNTKKFGIVKVIKEEAFDVGDNLFVSGVASIRLLILHKFLVVQGVIRIKQKIILN